MRIWTLRIWLCGYTHQRTCAAKNYMEARWRFGVDGIAPGVIWSIEELT